MWWFPILGIEGGLQTIFQRWDGPLGPRSDGILRNSTHELHEPCGIIGNGGLDLGFPMVFPWFSHGFPVPTPKKKTVFPGPGRQLARANCAERAQFTVWYFSCSCARKNICGQIENWELELSDAPCIHHTQEEPAEPGHWLHSFAMKRWRTWDRKPPKVTIP